MYIDTFVGKNKYRDPYIDTFVGKKKRKKERKLRPCMHD